MEVRGCSTAVCLVLSVILVFGMIGLAFAQHDVAVNGYSIDVKRAEPSVPADLDARNGGRLKKWIVQFTGPIQETDKNQIVDLGGRIGDYLPDFAFIVTMDNKTKEKVQELPFINGIVRYKPAYKVDKKRKDDSGEVLVEKGKKIKLAIKFDGKENQPVILSEVHKKKGNVLDVSNDIVRVEVDEADISHFAQIEEVLWIEEVTDLVLLNDNSKWTIQTYLSGNTKIWDKGLHGEGQIVGIGDTGLDYDMPWFRDPAGTAIGPMHRKIVGYDTRYGDDYDADYPGHGTHVAGTVGGDRTPVDGFSTANGMAPKSKFFIQDITPGSSNSVYPPSDLGLMFITAYNAGTRIHTNSWGGGSNSYDSMAMSADRFMWEHTDFLALFANGNSGPGAYTVVNPATAKNVVSVGATENGALAENMAWFSSNGPAYDGRIKPTVTAPGVGIFSADSDGVKNSNNSGTTVMSGTSMATPATAGAAALVRQYFTAGYYPGGAANGANAFTPSAALIKATLINSAQNMSGSYTDAPIPSSGQGWGRINLSNTLTFTGDPKPLKVHDNSTGLATGESWSQTYLVIYDQPLKVTLVWTDYPGTVGAAKAIVNDLDLTVTAPDGTTTYLGNVFSNGESVTGGSADRVNVEEQVLIKTPVKGSYTFRVSAYNIPNGPQPFALVIAGASVVTNFYGPWQYGYCNYDYDPASCWDPGTDTCDGNNGTAYVCPSGASKTCNDVADYANHSDRWGYVWDTWNRRTVICNSHNLTVSKAGTGSGTVTSSPAGISCGTDCTEPYFHGTTITLTAAPLPGSFFTGWSGGGCSGTGTCVVTLNDDASVTATFNVLTNIYGPWQYTFCNDGYDPASCWDSGIDTCDGNNGNAYVCPSGASKTCNDVADYAHHSDQWGYVWDTWNRRTVICGSIP